MKEEKIISFDLEKKVQYVGFKFNVPILINFILFVIISYVSIHKPYFSELLLKNNLLEFILNSFSYLFLILFFVEVYYASLKASVFNKDSKIYIKNLLNNYEFKLDEKESFRESLIYKDNSSYKIETLNLDTLVIKEIIN